MNNVDMLGQILLKTGVSERSMIIGCSILSEIFDPKTQRTFKNWSKRAGQKLSPSGCVNYVPSNMAGQCSDLLIIACEGRDNLWLNANQGIGICINCFKTLKAVVIATDYWDENYFDKMLKPAFKALFDNFGTTSFLYTPFAGKWELSAFNF